MSQGYHLNTRDIAIYRFGREKRIGLKCDNGQSLLILNVDQQSQHSL
jgi:hypothetical protein